METYLNKGIKEVITEFPSIEGILEDYEIGCGPCMVGTCLLKDIVEIHQLPPEQEQDGEDDGGDHGDGLRVAAHRRRPALDPQAIDGRTGRPGSRGAVAPAAAAPARTAKLPDSPPITILSQVLRLSQTV